MKHEDEDADDQLEHDIAAIEEGTYMKLYDNGDDHWTDRLDIEDAINVAILVGFDITGAEENKRGFILDLMTLLMDAGRDNMAFIRADAFIQSDGYDDVIEWYQLVHRIINWG